MKFRQTFPRLFTVKKSKTKTAGFPRKSGSLRLEHLEDRLAPSCSPGQVSGGQLTVNCDGSGNLVRVWTTPGGEFSSQSIGYWNGTRWDAVGFFYLQDTSITRMLVNTGAGVDTVRIEGVARALVVEGNGGLDNVTVGNNGSLGSINASVSVRNTPGGGYTALTVDNSASTTANTAQISSESIQFGGFGGTPIYYAQQDLRSLTLLGGSGSTTYDILGTPQSGFSGGMQTTIHGGSGVDTMNVLRTTGTLNINGGGGLDNVNIGDAGSLSLILGAINVSNPPAGGYTALRVDTSAYTGTYTATISDSSVSFGGVPVNFVAGDLRSLTVLGGSGANTYNITNTPISGFSGGMRTLLHGGGSADTINILATTGVMNVFGGGGLDVVNVGNAGRVQNIQASMTFSNDGGSSRVNINDESDPTSRMVTLDTQMTDAEYARITGTLMAATIYTRGRDTSTLNVSTGIGGATVNVLATATATNVIGNASTTTVNVGNAANRLDDIGRPLTVTGQAGITLNVNDQGTITDKSYEIYTDAVKRILNLDPVTYDAVVNYANIGTLTINGSGSNGNNVFFVVGTAANTNTILNGGAGVVNEFVAYSSNGLDSLLGPLTTHGRPGTNSFLVYNDTLAPTAQTYNLTTNTVSRSGAASVTFDNLNQVILYVPSVGGNTINVPSLAAGVLDNLSVADGDTVTIGSNQTVAAVLGQVALVPYDNTSATVVIDDSGNPTPLAGHITVGTSPPYGYLISGLIPGGIYLGQGQNTTLNTSLRTGAGDKTFNVLDAPQGVALNLDAGSGTNTLDYSAYASDVYANLQTGAATGLAGGIFNIQNVTGGQANNILVGNGGNVLTGGAGRNLLIAGASASTLVGGNDMDILIGGTTDFDTSFASLRAILDSWVTVGSDVDSYNAGVDALTADGGLLSPAAVHGNGGGNTLTGGPGLDLFFGSSTLDTHDWDMLQERFIEI